MSGNAHPTLTVPHTDQKPAPIALSSDNKGINVSLTPLKHGTALSSVPLEVSNVSITALLAEIVALFYKFQTDLRDFAMRNAQLFGEFDFDQVMKAFSTKCEGIQGESEARVNISQSKLGITAAAGGLALAACFLGGMGAMAANTISQSSNSVGSHWTDQHFQFDISDNNIRSQKGDIQQNLSRFFAESWQRLTDLFRQMSDAISQTANLTVSALRDLSKVFNMPMTV